MVAENIAATMMPTMPTGRQLQYEQDICVSGPVLREQVRQKLAADYRRKKHQRGSDEV